MKTTIPQRELRNRSGEMLRRAEAGEQITITVDGRPVAQLGPVPRRQWLRKLEYLAILQASGHDPTFFADVAGVAGEIAELDERWGGR
jgi:prevent-host-death family protein